MLPAKVPSDTVPISGLQLRFYIKKYKHFYVRYVKRVDTGNLVIQFFSEDPEVLEHCEMTGTPHEHVRFHKNFQAHMNALYSEKVSRPERLDISYISLFNSFCVMAKGYADAPGHVRLLEPLFEELDDRLEADAKT